MKKQMSLVSSLLALFALLLTYNSAFAADRALADQDVYGLSNFEIDQSSTELPQANQIANGAMIVDAEAKMLTLHLERNFFCPPNSICTQQMPEPKIIRLPITYIGTGFCGGQVISAEMDSRPADGIYVGVHFTNDEGNTCTKPKADDRGISKPVTIKFVEQSARDAQPTTSTFEGVLGILN